MNIHIPKHGKKRKSFRNKDKKQEFIKDIAFQRIEKLFHYALSTVKTDVELSRKYVLLARKIAMRARVHIPRTYRQMFCKKCNTILIPGFNARVRLRQNRFSRITLTCLSCGNIVRYPLKLKKNR
ncbi:MAG: ribonuclease P [Candidatus Odinarchaeota archaeon]|nr:ribonuclease P [Candidatus Odinarchaeota archaeon]